MVTVRYLSLRYAIQSKYGFLALADSTMPHRNLDRVQCQRGRKGTKLGGVLTVSEPLVEIGGFGPGGGAV